VKPNPPTGKTVYEEKRFSLRVCELELTNGKTQKRGVVIHPGAVVILPIAENGDLILIRNNRWQVGHRLLELPAGTLEPGEDPLQCAGRELVEETGYAAAQIEAFHTFFPMPGGSTEVMHCFLARKLTEVGQRLEPDEDIEVVPVSQDAIEKLLLNGDIVDGKTLALIGLYLLRQAKVSGDQFEESPK